MIAPWLDWGQLSRVKIPPCFSSFALGLVLLLPAVAQVELKWQIPLRLSSVGGVALGDLDGDGDLDACLCNIGAPSRILINDGAGEFILSEVHPELPFSGAAVFGDIDGDGDQDLVISSDFAPCSVYLNDGSGGLTDSGQSIGASAPRGDLLLVDLDGDTDLDLVIPTDSSSHKNEVWLNNGSGTFVDTNQNLGERFTISAAVGDLNGDTFPDLIMGNNGSNSVWFNDGSANFTQGTDLPLSGTTFGLAVADLDGDLDLDVFVANGSVGGQSNQVHLNDGTGAFTNLSQPSFTSDYHTAVVLKDLNGDTFPDAFVSRNRGQTNQVWVNDGSANFSLSGVDAGPGGSFGLGVGDLDGDLDTDFFLPTDSTPPVVLFRAPPAQGGPLVRSTQEIGGSQAQNATFADFDGDTDLDVALSNTAGTITFLLNDGTGELDDPGVILPNPVGNNATSIQAGDLDGINGPDLVIFATSYSGAADGRDRIWLNDGSGGFTESPQVLDDATNGSLRLGDVNGDTHLDIVVVNGTGFGFDGQNSIYLNNGSGSFTRSDALGDGNQRAMALFDVDGDLDLDVFAGGVGEPDKLWINNGSGVFTDSGQSLGSGSPLDVVVGHFNADTYPDVFCLNQNGGNRLWLNNSSGVLTDTGVSIAPSFGTAVAAYDYDDDNDLDLWVGYGGFSPGLDRIMLNDGTGSFSFGDQLADISTRDLLVADFTGDGTEDVFVASGQGDHQLWSADISPVTLWASGFGLTGDDTLPNADPDLDGLLNFEEMAFNLNPNLADRSQVDATALQGEPQIVVQTPTPGVRRFRAISIRRKAAPFLNYQLKTSVNVGGFVEPAGVTESTTNLNADYERVIFTYIAPTNLPEAFGIFEVTYDP